MKTRFGLPEDNPGEGMGGTGEGEQPAAPAAAPTADWRESIPETARGWDEVKNANSPDDVWSWVDNMRTFMGQSVRIPGPDASPEQIAEVAQRLVGKLPEHVMMRPTDLDSLGAALGRPEDANGYQVPEGMEAFPAVAEMKAVAHKASLNQQQFEAMLGNLAEIEQAQAEQAANRRQASLDVLKAEWGAAFDGKTEDVMKFLEHEGAPSIFIEAAKNGMFGGEEYKFFASLADRLVSGEGDTNRGLGNHRTELTPAEIRAKQADIRNNPTHPYNNPGSPGYQEALDEMVRLSRQLPGGADTVQARSFGRTIPGVSE